MLSMIVIMLLIYRYENQEHVCNATLIMSELPFANIEDNVLKELFVGEATVLPAIHTLQEELTNLDIGFNESLEQVFEDQSDLDPDENLFSRIHNDCNYINPDELNDKVSMHENNFRSLPKNFDYLLQFIEPIIDRLHCIIITEAWFQSQNVNLYNIQGFKATHNFRTKKSGGRVSIYIKNYITYTKIKILNISHSDYELIIILFIKISKGYINSSKDLLVGACYRPPNGDIEAFNNKIHEVLLSCQTREKCVYLAGDFNEISNSDIHGCDVIVCTIDTYHQNLLG